jgi:hypothetical protein
MKFDLNKLLEVLESTPSVLGSMLSGLNSDWVMQNEGGDSLTPAEIVCHLIHCEEEDWIPRINIILDESPDKKFKPFERTKGFEKSKEKTIIELVNEFEKLREKNLKYLKSIDLTEEQLTKTGIHPDFGEVTLKQLLATWIVHDLSHIAQINRVMSKQYSNEVGPWKQYLPILNR